MAKIYLQIFLSILGILIIVAIANAWLLLPAVVLCTLFYVFRRFYVSPARSLKRIDAIGELDTYVYARCTDHAARSQGSIVGMEPRYKLLKNQCPEKLHRKSTPPCYTTSSTYDRTQ